MEHNSESQTEKEKISNQGIPSQKLTEPLKIGIPERKFNFQPSICRALAAGEREGFKLSCLHQK